VPHPARVYDYWFGGKDNFAANREAAEQVIAANPTVLPGVRANRAFLGRPVHYLTEEAGIRDTDKVLAGAAETLDFSKPVAVMALMVLQYIWSCSTSRTQMTHGGSSGAFSRRFPQAATSPCPIRFATSTPPG
jgi:S-adenosyl methyltransferase